MTNERGRWKKCTHFECEQNDWNWAEIVQMRTLQRNERSHIILFLSLVRNLCACFILSDNFRRFLHTSVCAVCLALCAHSLRLYLLIFSFSFIRKTLLARFFLFSCCSSFSHIFLDVTAARLLFVTKHIQTSWSKCKIPCYRTDCCCCCLFSCMPCVRCFFMFFFVCVAFRWSCFDSAVDELTVEMQLE